MTCRPRRKARKAALAAAHRAFIRMKSSKLGEPGGMAAAGCRWQPAQAMNSPAKSLGGQLLPQLPSIESPDE